MIDIKAFEDRVAGIVQEALGVEPTRGQVAEQDVLNAESYLSIELFALSAPLAVSGVRLEGIQFAVTVGDQDRATAVANATKLGAAFVKARLGFQTGTEAVDGNLYAIPVIVTLVRNDAR